MIEQGRGGKIINAASIAGHQGFDHLGHYSASKFAVRGPHPGRGQGAGAQHGITVNAYCPGIVGTDDVGEIDEGSAATSAPGRARRSRSTRS